MKKPLVFLRLASILAILAVEFSLAIATPSTTCGDANGDAAINIKDITYVINFLYREGPSPEPLIAADVNTSGNINLKDITFQIKYLYQGGPQPACSKYLGQIPPDSTPRIFAPGLISTSEIEFVASFDTTFQEFYFTRRGGDGINRVYSSKIVSGSWNDPALAPFCDNYMTMEPLFTPDGQKLFFSSTRPCSGCGIANWYVTRDGTNWSDPQILGSPLNSVMMMYSTQSSNGNIYFTNISVNPPGIYVSQFIGGFYQTPVKLGTTINKGFEEAHPYIAPDESYMIFDAQNRPGGFGESDLYISFRNDDGSWTESLNLGPDFNTAGDDFCPTVSPDGKYFFFARWVGADKDIYWCDTTIIGKMRQGIPKIAFHTSQYGNIDICMVNPDGSGLQRLTTSSGADECPAFSPDGSKIAFISNRGGYSQLYVMNYDGSSQMCLTYTPEQKSSPDWSPDGTKIAYAKYWTPTWDSSDIFIIDADGNNDTRVTFGPSENTRPDWFPAGDKILFSSKRDGHYQLYSIDTDGSNLNRIRTSDTHDIFGQLSPDGARIIFSSGDVHAFETNLCIMNTDGTGLAQLTGDSGAEEDGVWSPDGTRIVYQHFKDGNFEFYIINADGTGKFRIPNLPTDQCWPSWGAIGAAPK